jgi:hypothetical protein
VKGPAFVKPGFERLFGLQDFLDSGVGGIKNAA